MEYRYGTKVDEVDEFFRKKRPWSVVKDKIVGDYIDCYLKTVQNLLRSILIVDGFSGPDGFDPAPLLQALQVPTLWLLGERDESVPTFATVRAIESIRAFGNHSHTVIVYAEADHSLRSVRTGESAPLWDDMLSWLQQNGLTNTANER